MKTYNLKSVLRRGSLLTAAFVIAGAAILPATSASADALNPLTERSLTLSSGSPGWSYTDGSGNDRYAPPNSGANGFKTGNTFSFRVSSEAELRAFTFQYCTYSAGVCSGPGNNTGNAGTRELNSASIENKRSDLEIVAPSPSEVDAADYPTLFDPASGQPLDALNVPNRDGSDGTFIVLHKRNLGDNWQVSSGWDMTASKVQNGPTDTNKNNFITLANEETTGLELEALDYVKIIFFGTDTNYITNPGAKEFFVKINTYNSATTFTDGPSGTLVDGGVTVANVMNRSIEIQTKVLETMQFSVGTVDPNTLDSTDPDGAGPLLSEFETATGEGAHSPCDPIATGMDINSPSPNVLLLGDEDGEFSLRTDTTYSTHSYWRLSSNSSAGATVYYSGVTLSNTVGDQIDEINGGTGTKALPTPGGEQFGLAMDNGTDYGINSNWRVSYATETNSGTGVFQNGADNGKNAIHTASLTTDNVVSNLSWHEPQLAPLAPLADYQNGTGNVNSEYGSVNTQFAFDKESNLVPAPFASGTKVVDCVTGKMRYIANIAATTPAGIYTTKINYIAAPKY